MLSIAVCDDSLHELESICAMVEGILSSRSLSGFEVLRYSSPDALMHDLENGGRCDIAVLDVIMPGSTGLDTARRIRDMRKEASIIFVSVSRDYAIDAYDVGAVHYIPKPITAPALEEALDRALAQIGKRPRQLVLSLKNAMLHSVECGDIIYIESVGYQRIVHTKEGVYEERKKTLSALMEELDQLSPGQFCIPYRGYIINLSEVATITSSCIVMKDGSRILIKRGDFRRIRDIYFSWTFSEAGMSDGRT